MVYRPEEHFITEEQGDLLGELRVRGLEFAIDTLSRLTVDWVDLGCKGISATVAAGRALESRSPSPSPMRGTSAQSAVAEGATKTFLEWVLKKAQKTLAKHRWAVQTINLLGKESTRILMAKLKEVLWSKEVLGAFIPFHSQIGAVLATAEHTYDAVAIKGSLTTLQANAELIGSGIPSVAVAGLQAFLHEEMLTSAGLAVYTFGKALASALVDILTVGIASPLKVVTTIIEFIVSWFHKVYQALTFADACERCQEWRRTGGGIDDFTESFGALMTACPLLGAFLFSIQNYIGTLNLTTMFTKRGLTVPISSIDAAAVKVHETQVIACRYLQQVGFKARFREAADQQRYGHMLTGLDRIVEAGTPPPSTGRRWASRAWRAIRAIF
jgi:hypothetical protein